MHALFNAFIFWVIFLRADQFEDRGNAMRFALAGVAAMAAVVGTPVMAADMALKAPPPVLPSPTYSWTGCHIGADAGGGWIADKDSETVAATGAASPFTPYPTDTATPSGVALGGYAGCDYQFSGGFVVGAEGDAEWANIRGGSANYIATGTPPDLYSTTSNFQASFRGRLGYGYNRVLFYATGGAAWARINEHDVIGTTGVFQDSSTTRPGWTVGAGIDYAFLDNWIGRIEYRYTDFGTYSYTTNVFPSFIENHAITENAVRVGLSYKFGVPLTPGY
jgi:outer membrane immunogenic protein